jgi:hypothetical protein
MATKKEATKKKATTKKATTKKATKKVAKITEEQFPSLVKDEINKELGEEVVEDKKIDWDKYKVKEGEYDLTKASKEEVTSAFKEMKPEDEVFVTKNLSEVCMDVTITPSKETEVMNGDPAVLTPIEEKVETEEAPKEEKPKITKRISKIFTYLWNGQMIDF